MISRERFPSAKPIRPWNARKSPPGVRNDERTRLGALQSMGKKQNRASSRRFTGEVLGDSLAVVVGLTASFTVQVVGMLPVAEPLILLLLPALLVVKRKKFNRPLILSIFAFMGLWLANQVLTDLYRGTVTADWLRGNAAIVFFAVDMMFLVVLLSQNERRKIVFIASYALGSLLAARFQPLAMMVDDPWKFGYSTGINTFALLVGAYLYDKRKYLATGIVLLAITGMNLLENFRSPVLGIFIAAALTTPIIPEHVGRIRLLPRRGTVARIAVLASMAISAGFAARGLIHVVTAAGVISEDQQAKNKQQSQMGILIAGRPEMLVSYRAVLEHPIVGFGSWARDFKYVEMLSDIQAESGIETDLTDTEESLQGLIPTHSHLMGAWVWAGILGATFWAYIFWLTLKSLAQISTHPPRLSLLYAWLLQGMMWNILFSPFGLTMRIVDAFVIVVIVDLLGHLDHGASDVTRQRHEQWRRYSWLKRGLVAPKIAFHRYHRNIPLVRTK
jgi:hypothetical protein